MKALYITFSSLLVAAGLVSFVGCETESAATPVYIEPSAATVRAGGSVAFRAVGGYDYRWSLSNPALGYLSAAVGPSTVYTAAAGAATNSSQTLHLTSTIAGTSSTAATNAFSYGQTTQAIITHL